MRKLSYAVFLGTSFFIHPATAEYGYYPIYAGAPSVEVDYGVLGEENGLPQMPYQTAPAAPLAPVMQEPLAPSPAKPGKRLLKPLSPAEQPAAPVPISKPSRSAVLKPMHTPPLPVQKPAFENIGDLRSDEMAAPIPVPAAAPVVPAIDDLTLEFDGNASSLTADSEKKLKSLLPQLSEVEGRRLQVRAYATGGDGKSDARRISLSRALTVRTFLMDHGIKPTRIDVRAMGSETDRAPLDRVDLVFAR